MSFLHQRGGAAAAALFVSGLVAGSAAGVAGPAAAAASAGSAHAAPSRAIVAITGTTAVGAPGVRVVTVLPGVHSEVVTGTPAALAGLRRDPRVLGVRADTKVELAGHDYGSGNGVFAWQGLGGQAGRDRAGHGVTVALVDTGVSDTAALNRAGGRLVDAVDTSPLVDLAAPRTSGTFTDGFGHGTFLATLIAGGPVAATGHRPVGVAPGATVDVVKVAKDDGSTSLAAVLAGLDWVALHADSVQVANVALGIPTGGQWGADPLNLATEWVRQAGVLVVAASGNVAGEVSDPGFDPKNVTVGAADTTAGAADVADFSGSGTIAGVRKPDLVAPGRGLLGLLPAGSQIARDYPDARQPNGLWRGSGTSEATAVTTGVAAIYYAAHPDATTAQAKAALRGSARPMHDAAAGAGLLHVVDRADPRPTAADTGEAGFDQVAWVSTPWAAASWAAASWAAASWARAASWAGADWDAASWACGWWQAASWAAASWAGADWDAASWARAASWAGVSWSGVSWSGVSWSGVSWSGVSWSGVSWGDTPDGVSWSGVSWGDTPDGVSWSGVSWSGVSWSGVSWGDTPDGVSWSGVSWSGVSWG